MRSWRTNIGGAIGVLGKGLAGIGTVTAIGQFNGYGNISPVVQWAVLVGVLLTCFGDFFTALFAVDHQVVKEITDAQNEKISQIAHDTGTIVKPPKPPTI